MTRRTVLVLAIASFAFAVLALMQAWTDAPTYDEPTYVTAGLTSLTRHDLRINPQHPPLAKLVAAVPVLALRPTIPRGPGWRTANERVLSAAFVRAQLDDGRLRAVFFAARLLPVLEAIAAGWVIALLAGELFGPGTAWLPGLLWLANPFVVGLGHVDGIDVPFALTALVAALAVLHARRRPSVRMATLVGVCGGLSVVTRATGLLVVAAAVVAVVAARGAGRPRRAAVVLGTAWLTIAIVYAAIAPAAVVSHRAGWLAVPSTLARFAVPPSWLHGLGRLLRSGSQPGPAFILGRAHIGRWLWFWPASMAVKLPPTTLIALAAAPLAWARLPRAARREAAWVIGLPALLLAAFTVQQQRPIGLRYFLPVLALWTVAAGAMLPALGTRLRRSVAGIAVVGAVGACAIVPSLAWTDPVLGAGYRVAADSNLDWGQGFLALRSWAPGHHPWVEYFGGAGFDRAHLAGARDLRQAPASLTGWVAVSASALTDYHRAELSWLRRYCPVQVLDRTILVYRFGRPPVRTGRAPGAPPPPCPGRFSRLRS